ncbi:MAG: shikimate dehydrogenase [Bacillota bacterium]
MNKFAFLIHPIKPKDAVRKFKFMESFPDPVIEKILDFLPPMKVSEITGIRSKTGAEIKGWFIALPRTPRQILEMPLEKAYNLITKAGKMAEDLGAQIFGLGAFTKVIGDKGISIAKRLRIPVTTGNSYTSASAIDSTLLAAQKMEIDLSGAKASVIGAAGSIGAACAKVLARKVPKLTLADRSIDLLAPVKKELHENNSCAISVSTDPRESVKDADIVIAVSSATGVIVEPGDLKPGAVICDVARPRNLSRAVNDARDDVLVIDGGVIKVPGQMELGIDIGFPPDCAEACMAETMILTLESRFECFTLGSELSLEKLDTISELADKHGFEIAGFRRFEKAIPDEEIIWRRDNSRKKRERLTVNL